MNRRLLIISAAVIVLISAVCGYLIGAKPFLSSQRADLKLRIETFTNFLNTIREQRQKRPALTADLDSYIARTLGGKFETVDSRLRERLNRICEELQLKQLTVSTSRPAPLTSPAKARYVRRSDRAFHDEIDFVELDGAITGEGSLEQALRLVHRIQSEPWIKRVHQFKLEPRDNGERFVITLRLTTLFLPEHEPRELPAAAYDASGFAPYTMLVSANPFKVPTPAPQPPKPPKPGPEPPPAPAYAYGQWTITIVAPEGPGGPEVGLVNKTTGESRTLLVGQSLQQATLVAILGDQAQFRLGEDQFLIAVGRSLDDRTPLKR